MDPLHHDMVLAITSHVPHLIAYNIVGTAAHLGEVTQSEVIKFSAGGFRDFTRIAASDPTMWRDVFLHNKDAVLEMLGRFSEDLSVLTRAIRFGDGKTLFDLFTHTRAIRRSIIEIGRRRRTRFRPHPQGKGTARAARASVQRAADLDQVGALFPWRTINGEEASAYYAAGTAQYHINAAIALAVKRYLDASGDVDFLAGEAAELLVQTARLWEDLGFYAANGEETFRIHGVTGPDEYTTVVNDNLYTNVMARFNMRYAARVVDLLREWDTDAYDRLARRVGLQDDETKRWTRASEAMFLPYDEELGIHPQDDRFLHLEVVGLREHRRRTSTRCCCTSTRS